MICLHTCSVYCSLSRSSLVTVDLPPSTSWTSVCSLHWRDELTCAPAALIPNQCFHCVNSYDCMSPVSHYKNNYLPNLSRTVGCVRAITRAKERVLLVVSCPVKVGSEESTIWIMSSTGFTTELTSNIVSDEVVNKYLNVDFLLNSCINVHKEVDL